jgi:hypothetical protein
VVTQATVVGPDRDRRNLAVHVELALVDHTVADATGATGAANRPNRSPSHRQHHLRSVG